LDVTGGGTTQATASFNWAVGQWQHVAWTRQGAIYRYFKDGALVAQSTSGTLSADSVNSLFIGGHSDHFGQSSFEGDLDEVRITKGVARYTASFAAPTEAFPDQ
jgi:hypothetical protein